MRFLKDEEGRFGFLVVIIFFIASIAAFHIMRFMGSQTVAEDAQFVALMVRALTIGLILLLGAFGIWASQLSSEASARRRISELVDTMDYIDDGMVLVDPKGDITAFNPAAARLASTRIGHRDHLAKAFSYLLPEAEATLIESDTPQEVECTFTHTEGPEATRTVRFRSQPLEDLSLIIISDVTSANVERLRNLQIAKLQLISQIAADVSNDFNDLLCRISENAACLPRIKGDSVALERTVAEITRETESGVVLARHLRDLSSPVLIDQYTDLAGNHIKVAVDNLREQLAHGWDIRFTCDPDLPPIGLTGTQIEQAVTSLGQLVFTDATDTGTIVVEASRTPNAVPEAPDQPQPVAQVDIYRMRSPEHHEHVRSSTPSSAILSVVKSLLHETGGALLLLNDQSNRTGYRMQLPPGLGSFEPEDPGEIPVELADYFSGWHVMLGTAVSPNGALLERLAALGIDVRHYEDIVEVLTQLEGTTPLDVLIIDTFLLRPEPAGMLRAILKLNPSSGIVVLSEPQGMAKDTSSNDVVFVPRSSLPNRIMLAMIEAKRLAVARERNRA